MSDKKRNFNNLNNGLAMIGFILIIGIVSIAIYKDEKDMRRQEKIYIEKEAELNRQIEEENQRTKTLNEKKKYVATDEYIEEVAKEKLGLINPDEVLIKAKDE